MPDWRSQPTWDLICELMGQRRIDQIKAVLNERMASLGAQDLSELITMEAMYNNDTGLPVMVDWDPAIITAGITLPYDDGDDVVRPLHLKWVAKTQMWAASTLLVEPDAHMSRFGYYSNVAEADAAYRALVGRMHDDSRVTEVFVNNERQSRTIVGGHIVPPLESVV